MAGSHEVGGSSPPGSTCRTNGHPADRTLQTATYRLRAAGDGFTGAREPVGEVTIPLGTRLCGDNPIVGAFPKFFAEDGVAFVPRGGAGGKERTRLNAPEQPANQLVQTGKDQTMTMAKITASMVTGTKHEATGAYMALGDRRAFERRFNTSVLAVE